MNVFETLPEVLQMALKRMLITQPTPIQARALPPALTGRDVLGTAQTGTGKTLAFLLPLGVRLLNDPSERALVLSPTRELAEQIAAELEKLLPQLTVALIIGGDNIHKQYAALRRHPRVIIATPGRLLDHLRRKSVDVSHTHFLVLDETDRMLDMGFIEDMHCIAAALPAPRQTLLFSATLPPEIVQLAKEFLTNPVRVQTGAVTAAACNVLQEIVSVGVREKLPQLLHELHTRAGSILVFVKTKHGAERLAKELKRYGQKASALHGELRQNRRRQIMEFFRSGTVRVLVATDLAARGLDVAHIAHVINYDLPQSPADYIHRIGRTGRAGAAGSAVSFICGDEEKWQEICRITQFDTPVKTVQKTIDPLPVPKFVAQEEGTAHARHRPKSAALKPASQPVLPPTHSTPVLPKSRVSMREAKKPKTFQKSAVSARILSQDFAAHPSRTGTKKSAKPFCSPTRPSRKKFVKRKRR